jgi:hypothetical protein
MVEVLQTQGVFVQQLWADSGAGQFTLELPQLSCMRCVDSFYTVKETVRATAHKAGLKATFVAKLSSTSPASLVVLRLAVGKDERMSWEKGSVPNMFFAGGQLKGFFFAYFYVLKLFLTVLGRLHCLQAVRFASANAFAQKQSPLSWGWQQSVDAPLRAYGPDFLELDCDGTCNVYMLLAAVVVCGLDGLVQGKSLPEADEAAGLLPADLAAALGELEKDSELLGKEEIVKCYLAVKRAELEVKTVLPVLLERF